jgi:hypothetical protein
MARATDPVAARKRFAPSDSSSIEELSAELQIYIDVRRLKGNVVSAHPITGSLT